MSIPFEELLTTGVAACLKNELLNLAPIFGSILKAYSSNKAPDDLRGFAIYLTYT